MIKIDWIRYIRDYVWCGWQYVPALITKPNSRWTAKWYWLGYEFAFYPIRRRGADYPIWYLKLMKIRH